jgi:hypothetical protein
LEGRVVLPHTAVAPALAPALISSVAPVVQQASSLLPITVNSVNITGVANNALQLVANATAGSQSFQIPLTLTNTTPNATTPILDLHLNAIHLNLLGLQVDTSNICLQINAQSGPGNLLGNVLTDVAHLLDSNANTQALLNKLNKIAGEIGALL